MPISSRCPTCSAAVPQGASWCSLCHADLRPRPAAPVAGTTTLEPGELADLPVPDADDRVLVGRAQARPAAPRSGGGRHARPEPVGRRERRTPDLTIDPRDLEELELPEGEATPEQVEALADQMLLRLAVTEPKSRLLDPEEVPGGKWALAAVGTVLVVSVLLIVYTVLGALLGG